MDADEPWLLLLYTLPAEPSRARVHAWRVLKDLGALRLPAGGYVMPDSDTNRVALRELAARVNAWGGSAVLFEAAPLDVDAVAAIRERYRAQRAEEYADIARDVARLHAHIEREMEHFAFTWAEFEGLEAELDKLRRRLETVARRDALGAEQRTRVEGAIEGCAELLAGFADEVFAAETAAPDERRP